MYVIVIWISISLLYVATSVYLHRKYVGVLPNSIKYMFLAIGVGIMVITVVDLLVSGMAGDTLVQYLSIISICIAWALGIISVVQYSNLVRG